MRSNLLILVCAGLCLISIPEIVIAGDGTVYNMDPCLSSSTVGYQGSPVSIGGDGSKCGNSFSLVPGGFGRDIRVRGTNQTSKEINQDMAGDADGGLYVIWEDDYLAYNYLQIYKSTDGGRTWASLAYLQNANADLMQPSIAVGYGKRKRLLVAYIKDDGIKCPRPEVASIPLNGGSITTQQVPIDLTFSEYANPVIWTDCVHYNVWNAYITCEAHASMAHGGVDVIFSRSTDYAETWSTPTTLHGTMHSHHYIDPDGAYGTSEQRVFVSYYNENTLTVYAKTSDDRGASFDPAVAVYTLPSEPYKPVTPEIEAAVNHDNVMICCTVEEPVDNSDDMAYTCSIDAGNTWPAMQDIPNNIPFAEEYSARLTANEGGGSFHLAYLVGNTGEVYYTCRPQDLSEPWQMQESRCRADDLSTANKGLGIASNWTTDVAGVVWADYRDGQPDYDTMFDYVGNPGLSVDNYLVEGSEGGSYRFFLNAGAQNKNRMYILLASVTGISPGLPLPGGHAVLPINYDFFTRTVQDLINTSIFQNFLGFLDGKGKAEAWFNLPPVTVIDPVTIHFAFAVNNPWNFASNPVEILIWY